MFEKKAKVPKGQVDMHVFSSYRRKLMKQDVHEVGSTEQLLQGGSHFWHVLLAKFS